MTQKQISEIKKRIFKNKDILTIFDDNIDYRFLNIFYNFITKTEKPIILLSSTGGDGDITNGIIEIIRNCGKKITIVGIGKIQSAAILILANGYYRLSFKNVSFYSHQPSLTNNSLYNKIKNRNKIKQFTKIYKEEYKKINLEQLGNLKNYNFTENEAKKIGLIDEII